MDHVYLRLGNQKRVGAPWVKNLGHRLFPAQSKRRRVTLGQKEEENNSFVFWHGTKKAWPWKYYFYGIFNWPQGHSQVRVWDPNPLYEVTSSQAENLTTFKTAHKEVPLRHHVVRKKAWLLLKNPRRTISISIKEGIIIVKQNHPKKDNLLERSTASSKNQRLFLSLSKRESSLSKNYPLKDNLEMEMDRFF